MEFEFDFPFEVVEKEIHQLMEAKGCTYDEASQSLYNEKWKWKRRELQLETRCLSAFIERLWPKIKFPFWKIIIEFVQEINYEKPRILLDVCIVQQNYNLEIYEKKDPLLKLNFLLECAMNAIMQISEYSPEILPIFYPIFEEIQKKEFRNIWYWKPPIFNPSKTFSAQIRIEHTMKNVCGYAVVIEKSSKKEQIISLFKTLPDERIYGLLLGKFMWESNEMLKLYSKTGKEVCAKLIQNS